jgi:cellulose synthase/poly-beta-1,6-N-acetylglucosamine synthase-like glycosyltransferase
MSDLLLSIVIIGRNEGARLERCLESVASARGFRDRAEIIYVDSASSDGSPERARALHAEVIVLDGQKLTAARGRNEGWRRARAPYILFLDGDTILDADFPRLAMNALALDERIAAVWGHRREIHTERSIYNRVLDLDWIYAPGDTEFCGGDVLMRRRALEEVEGYDSTLIAGEEPELCRRLRHRGYRILHIDAPMTGHDLDMNRFGQYWKRALRAGHAYAEMSLRFRDTPDPMWFQESRNNIVRGVFWIASFLLCALSLGFSRVPLALWLVLVAVLSCRSAWKAQWKAPGRTTLLLLYGVHSQLQQVPIFVGQLLFNRHRKAGGQRALIEYKQGSGL